MSAIIQPNRITTAKYNFTAVQKNIMYHIIGHIQDKMTKDPGVADAMILEVNKTLFGEEIITLKLMDLDKHRNYSRVLEEAKDMINKKIEYRYKDKKGNEHETVTTLVASIDHETGSQYVSFFVPSRAVPVFCYIGEGGFTKYRQTVAISLNSIYSKRLYEMCCRWEDKGGFVISIEEFRGSLKIPSSYKNANIKQKILEVAKKELKDTADVYYEYKLAKSKGSRAFDTINFKVISKKDKGRTEEIKLINEEAYKYIYHFLSIHFPGKEMMITDKIAGKDQLEAFQKRLELLDDEISSGKRKAAVKPLLAHILREDYNIELNKI